jgi:mannan endo-1,4-beta-mannosidase
VTAPPPESAGAGPAEPAPRRPLRRRLARAVISVVMVAGVAAATVGVVRLAAPAVRAPLPAVSSSDPAIGTFSHHHVVITLPARPASYLGAFIKGTPASYAPVQSFAQSTGVQPNIVLFYSGWYEKFQSGFATQVTAHGGVPFFQIDPTGVSVAAIGIGAYDTYLKRLATDVASYGAKTGHGVIIGFGHEMNGQWFPWGYRHVAPKLFVKAWQHIVEVFRQQGADDVTWLWTVNIIDNKGGIPSPAPWWPGERYVTWVGIDGYYLQSSWTFASLFGPTIKAIRALTIDPVLISETAAAPASAQPAKLADLFAGVHSYGLLGFVWFDADHAGNWRLSTPAAFAAYRQGAATFGRPSA